MFFKKDIDLFPKRCGRFSKKMRTFLKKMQTFFQKDADVFKKDADVFPKSCRRFSQSFVFLTARNAKSLRKERKELYRVININFNSMTENELSKNVFDLGIKVHKVLCPGLLESAYEECLYYDKKSC